jgi:class 3 adenylate cyclase/CHASE2 domain-containing sensor protein
MTTARLAGLRYTVPAIIGIAVLAILWATYGLWDAIERKAYDYRFQLTGLLDIGRSQTSGRIVVVGIDERSVVQTKPIVFLYPDIGKFLVKMQEYKAALIAIDMIPIHRQAEKLKGGMGSFADDPTNRRYGNTISEIGEKLDNALLEPLIAVSQRTPVVQAYHGGLVPFYYGVAPFMKRLYPADITFTDGMKGVGDGVIRKQGLKADGKDTFAYAIYNVLTGSVYEGTFVRPNYALAKRIPFYCFDDVMSGKVADNIFQEKAVILGYLTEYEDVHFTPIQDKIAYACSNQERKEAVYGKDNRMPGQLIHAVIAETLLTDTSLRDSPYATNMIILLILVSVTLAISMTTRPAYSLAATLCVAILFLAGNLFAFSRGYVVNVFPQLIAPFITLMLVYPYRYVTEERTRKKLYKVFSYYIDRDVLDSLLEKDIAGLFRGESKDISIMFLDIRDFTRLSRREKAENIVQFLNFYFGAVTGIIQKHNGFVNKFIGDGILAFFAIKEDAIVNAIEASQEIISETERMKNEKAFEGFIGDWVVNIGIGIHYGTVIVGNVGSEKKMDFTIVGEHVNIASRIEGLTKQANANLLVSDEAYTLVKDRFNFIYLGDYEVKGVDRPLPIYTVAGK